MTTRDSSQTVQFGTTQITYDVAFVRRKTLAIHVYPDGSVRVRAPQGSTREAVNAIVHKRAAWIVKQQHRFRDYAPAAPRDRDYVSGEDERYLGRQYRLKVIEGTPEGVTPGRTELVVRTRDRSPRRVQRILDGWFRAEARRIFAERLAACWKRVEHLDLAPPTIVVRRMKSRWGSCGRTGKILLNLRLVQAPVDLIDYVIVHELCHLKEHNHSKRYYAVLDAAMPDWNERRQRLNSFEFVAW